MKKIYENGDLVGWNYKGILIKINYYDITYYGNWHKDYIVDKLANIGKASRFETLKECKEYIDKYIENLD